jgi:hypothetical protein
MSKLKTLNAADYEDELDPIDKLILKCLREHLADYYPEDEVNKKEDAEWWINRIRDRMVLEEINKVFIMNNW